MNCQRELSFLLRIQIPILWVGQVECQLMAVINRGSLPLSVGLEWGCMAQGVSPHQEELQEELWCQGVHRTGDLIKTEGNHGAG